MDDYTRGIGDLRGLIGGLDGKVDRRFDALSSRIDALDQKLDRRVDVLDQKLSHQFTWVIGLQVTTLLALLTGSLGVISVLLTR